MNSFQQGFRSVVSFSFGGQESASKPPQAICKPLALMQKKPHTIKIRLLIPIIALFYTGCVWDDPITTRKITKDYYLRWVYEKNEQIIIRSSDGGKQGGTVVGETVFAVGFDENYIIAKQHPNLEKEVSQRLFSERAANGDYVLSNPNDTIYLWKGDEYYQENGKWFHKTNGWDPTDSLKPYKAKTIYHIIQIGEENRTQYKFENENQFLAKRKKLGIPENLDFTIVDEDLE